MTDIAIRSDSLGKQYRIGSQRPYKSLRESLAQAFSSTYDKDEPFWALRDVSFEVHSGEVIGVIGRNGAGKSTLLKILSRITDPTVGRVEIFGRVGSLLEIGTGFHPELTGRENIFLNGAVLGMRRSEIRSRFDQIVDFAEITQFLDTPVKHYSSGMYMRLAFAVAAHLEPEIMVVDEVLAVGDAQFQKKCLGKMAEVAGAGRTVLFVSHNLGAVNRLCARALWIDVGRIVANGPTADVIAQYLLSHQSSNAEVTWPDGFANPGTDGLRVFALRVRNAQGQISASLDVRQYFTIELSYRISKPLPYCRAGFMLAAADGTMVFDAYDADDDAFQGSREPGEYNVKCEVPGNLLSPGGYMLTLNIGMPNIASFARLEGIISLTIQDTGAIGSNLHAQRFGVIRPRLKWSRT